MNGSDSQSGEGLPLLVTNMRVPQLHEELMPRTGLLEKLNRILHFPLTLIAAPAGFGKTTALVQWITGGKKEVQDRVAWVSLERESDLGRFWRYLLTALEGVQPEIARPALALLDSPQPPFHSALTTLLNEITLVADDIVLILDDYHLIDDPSIQATLGFFIDHLPANLHIVLSSRSEPPLALARRRAGNRLYELGVDDFRLSPVEVATFLNETKALTLSDGDVAALEARTEGWIAGLKLAALAMQGYDDRSKQRFISEFTGNQRYIFDYLLQEALERQPKKVRSFLLQTSVLNRLSAGLCNAVTAQADGQAVLAYLERTNMFTIPLDQERRWYRYHHLFRDVLRHRLQHEQPDMALRLHRRAAAWCKENDEVELAIDHACAAEEWEQAIELTASRISRSWNRGEIRRILNWLGKLPAQFLNVHPDLSLYYSRALLLGGQMSAAEQRLREAERVLRDRLNAQSNEQDSVLLGTVYAFRTTLAAVTGETTSALALGESALALLPQANIDIRGHAINSLGVAHYYLGQLDEASQMCAEAGELARREGNLYLFMAAAAYRAKALASLGQLRQAGQVLDEALSLSASPEQLGQAKIPAASVVCAGYGRLLYEWNRLEEAEQFLTEAIELGQLLSFGSALWSAYHTLALIRLVDGDRDGAQSMLAQARRYQESKSVPLPERLMEAELARSYMALGQLDAAERWALTLSPDASTPIDLIGAMEMVTLARLWLVQGRPEQALTLLDQLQPPAESGERRAQIVEILVLTALTQQALGNIPLATGALRSALVLAQPEGYTRTFIDAGQPMAALLYQGLSSDVLPDYGNELLTLFPLDERLSELSPASTSAGGGAQADEYLIEPLTPRELEVLQLIAEGATNEDLAEQLTIAVSTAKKHVSNIIQKLGVDNRTQAAAKGRNLGLCD